MANPTLQENSRQIWTLSTPEVRGQMANINGGTLLRIADALEKIAQGYDALTASRDGYKHLLEETQVQLKRRDLSIRAMRGVITRMTRKI